MSNILFDADELPLELSSLGNLGKKQSIPFCAEDAISAEYLKRKGKSVCVTFRGQGPRGNFQIVAKDEENLKSSQHTEKKRSQF